MKRNEFKIEVCANSLQSVLAAKEAGAESIELCSGLTEGGTTPSYAFIRFACAVENLHINVMVRPRGGDFLYDELEKDIMLQDIAAAKFLGADGIESGALNADGTIDAEFLKKCIEAAYPLPFTFHRAFDMCRDPFAALRTLEECGCVRLLTSGMKNTAEEGVELIKQLLERRNKLQIVPAGSIHADNIRHIAQATGAKEFHLSGRTPKQSGMMFRNTGIFIGKTPEDEDAGNFSEYTTEITAAEIVRDIIRRLEKV